MGNGHTWKTVIGEYGDNHSQETRPTPERSWTVYLLLYSPIQYLYYFSYICRMKTAYIILGTISLAFQGSSAYSCPCCPQPPFCCSPLSSSENSPVYTNGCWTINTSAPTSAISARTGHSFTSKIYSPTIDVGKHSLLHFFLILWWGKNTMFLIAMGVTRHILSFKTWNRTPSRLQGGMKKPLCMYSALVLLMQALSLSSSKINTTVYQCIIYNRV